MVPIILRPVDWTGTPFAHLQALPINAKPITTWSNQDEAFADVAAGIRRVIEDLPLLAASASRAVLPDVWSIPYPRNSFFTGREDALSLLHTYLQASKTTAISQPVLAVSGLGGIGKTQIAVEYAYRYHQNYQFVLWARAESREALIQQKHIRIPEAAMLLTHLGWYLAERGQHAEAELPLMYAMTIHKQKRNAEDLHTAFTANTLGYLYVEQEK